MDTHRQAFLSFCLAHEVLRFGDFVTKAGRRSPYFFNAGLFDDGESLRRLGEFYADALVRSGVAFRELEVAPVSLEDAFVALTREDTT